MGLGSLWWALVVPGSLALALALGVSAGGGRSRWLVVVVAPVVASMIGAVVYPSRVAGGVNSAITAIVACGVALGIALWRSNTRLGEVNRQLAVERAVWQERTELAGRVHDRLGHRLNHTVVGLGALWQEAEPGSHEAEVLARARGEVAEVLEEIGDLVLLLDAGQSPSQERLDVEGLVRRARDAGTPVQGQVRDIESQPERVREPMMRVLAETLSNAVRHSSRQPVDVHFEVADDIAVLTIRNSLAPSHGRMPTRTAGTGLRRVRADVEAAGGNLQVDSDHDFTVTARIPLWAAS